MAGSDAGQGSGDESAGLLDARAVRGGDYGGAAFLNTIEVMGTGWGAEELVSDEDESADLGAGAAGGAAAPARVGRRPSGEGAASAGAGAERRLVTPSADLYYERGFQEDGAGARGVAPAPVRVDRSPSGEGAASAVLARDSSPTVRAWFDRELKSLWKMLQNAYSGFIGLPFDLKFITFLILTMNTLRIAIRPLMDNYLEGTVSDDVWDSFGEREQLPYQAAPGATQDLMYHHNPLTDNLLLQPVAFNLYLAAAWAIRHVAVFSWRRSQSARDDFSSVMTQYNRFARVLLVAFAAKQVGFYHAARDGMTNAGAIIMNSDEQDFPREWLQLKIYALFGSLSSYMPDTETAFLLAMTGLLLSYSNARAREEVANAANRGFGETELETVRVAGDELTLYRVGAFLARNGQEWALDERCSEVLRSAAIEAATAATATIQAPDWGASGVATASGATATINEAFMTTLGTQLQRASEEQIAEIEGFAEVLGQDTAQGQAVMSLVVDLHSRRAPRASLSEPAPREVSGDLMAFNTGAGDGAAAGSQASNASVLALASYLQVQIEDLRQEIALVQVDGDLDDALKAASEQLGRVAARNMLVQDVTAHDVLDLAISTARRGLTARQGGAGAAADSGSAHLLLDAASKIAEGVHRFVSSASPRGKVSRLARDGGGGGGGGGAAADPMMPAGGEGDGGYLTDDDPDDDQGGGGLYTVATDYGFPFAGSLAAPDVDAAAGATVRDGGGGAAAGTPVAPVAPGTPAIPGGASGADLFGSVDTVAGTPGTPAGTSSAHLRGSVRTVEGTPARSEGGAAAGALRFFGSGATAASTPAAGDQALAALAAEAQRVAMQRVREEEGAGGSAAGALNPADQADQAIQKLFVDFIRLSQFHKPGARALTAEEVNALATALVNDEELFPVAGTAFGSTIQLLGGHDQRPIAVILNAQAEAKGLASVIAFPETGGVLTHYQRFLQALRAIKNSVPASPPLSSSRAPSPSSASPRLG